MHIAQICLLAALAADAGDPEFSSVYVPSNKFHVAIRGQSPRYEEPLSGTQAQTLAQAPGYPAPLGRGAVPWGQPLGGPLPFFGALGPCANYCPPFWQHRTKLFGEFLYLSARDADVSYATPVDGLGLLAVPIGPAAVAGLDSEAGFRVGGALMLDQSSSVNASFWKFGSEASDRVSLLGGAGLLRSSLVHPNTPNAAADSLSARAKYDIKFEIIDLNYSALIWGGASYAVNYEIGVRIAHLSEEFLATYLINGLTTVDTDIDFEGAGPRIQLDGERVFRTGLLLYARTSASFLLGEFEADYRQANILTGQQARTGFKDDRIVPMLEFELGGGWQSRCGRIRVTAGYLFGSWFNAVTTPEFINAAQTDSFDGVDGTLTFSGLTTRLELRF